MNGTRVLSQGWAGAGRAASLEDGAGRALLGTKFDSAYRLVSLVLPGDLPPIAVSYDQ